MDCVGLSDHLDAGCIPNVGHIEPVSTLANGKTSAAKHHIAKKNRMNLSKYELGGVRVCIAIYLTSFLLHLAIGQRTTITILSVATTIYALNIFWLWQFDKMPKLFKEHLYYYPIMIGLDLIFAIYQEELTLVDWALFGWTIVVTVFFARSWRKYFESCTL